MIKSETVVKDMVQEQCTDKSDTVDGDALDKESYTIWRKSGRIGVKATCRTSFWTHEDKVILKIACELK